MIHLNSYFTLFTRILAPKEPVPARPYGSGSASITDTTLIPSIHTVSCPSRISIRNPIILPCLYRTPLTPQFLPAESILQRNISFPSNPTKYPLYPAWICAGYTRSRVAHTQEKAGRTFAVEFIEQHIRFNESIGMEPFFQNGIKPGPVDPSACLPYDRY